MNEHLEQTPEPNPSPPDSPAKAAAGSASVPPAHPPDGVPPSEPPPRGPALAWLLLFLAFGGLMLWVGVHWHEPIRDRVSRAAQAVWIGDSPHAGHVHANGKHLYYTCGMHPWVVVPEPGLCPICHMQLVPLDPAMFTGEIAIDPRVVQSIGVRVAPAAYGSLSSDLRTVGSISYDEASVRDVTTKTAGWIEKLHVDAVGDVVQSGQVLFEIYSPELLAAQEEYLLALHGRTRLTSGVSADADAAAGQLVEAARTRLLRLDLSDEQIRQLEERGRPTRTLAFVSSVRGVVLERDAYEGMRIDPGMRAYRIADLSRVWVNAVLYEDQLSRVRVGQRARISLSNRPGETFTGEVAYVYPFLNEQARQARVRIELDNPDLTLKPGMFANVALEATADKPAILLPREAVIDTGVQQTVFISSGEGRFEPRKVQLGRSGGGLVEVLDGVKPGEQVVVSGQFLLDSESRRREALARMITGDSATPGEEQASPVPTAPEAAHPHGAGG